MVLDVSLGILTPDDWVVAFRFEKLCNMPGPCFDRVEPFLAEHAYYMSLNGNDGGGGKVVSENAECCGGLQWCQGFEWLQVVNYLPDDTLRHCAESVQGR